MRISDWSSDVCSSDLREVIADSIELAVDGHCLDAMVVLCGCDKTIPAAAMAMARLNIPAVALYGGSNAHGNHDNHRSEERRVGQKCVRTCIYCWPPYHINKHTKKAQSEKYNKY